MKSWFSKWFSFSWKKLVLVVILAPAFWFVQNIEFSRVDAFNRDAFQFLNSKANIEKSLVTININGKQNNFTRPFDFVDIKKLIDKILEENPKNLIIALSNSDLYYNDNDIREQVVNYLIPHKNVIFFSTSSEVDEDIAIDPIVKKFPRQIRITLSKDGSMGARDFKRRRSLVELDRVGPAKEFKEIEALGYSVKSPDDFKHAWHWWGARLAFLKVFQVGTFGSYDAGWLLQQPRGSLKLEGKTVILGPNDEYSFLFSHSIFDLFGKIGTSDYKAYPVADSIANAMNMYITGDYIKVTENFPDLLIVFTIMSLLVFSNFEIKKKIVIFALLIPIILSLTAIVYMASDFYINVTRSITLLFFLQYFAIPLVVLNIFKEQESKKLQEINDTRIDALLTVSEKVAHDIRSPLSAINLVMTRAKFDDPEYKEIFDGAVKRIEETATKILTQYRTKTGRENEQLEKVDLSAIINEIAKEKKILNSKIDFEIVTTSDNGSALAAKLDMERIVSNILDNSIFALKSIIEPKIFIGIEDSNNLISLSITDNGIGIPEQIVKLLGNERITTKADTNQGNGIGLLHAKRVIERFNGRFEISSQENVGTTIKISLPKA